MALSSPESFAGGVSNCGTSCRCISLRSNLGAGRTLTLSGCNFTTSSCKLSPTRILLRCIEVNWLISTSNCGGRLAKGALSFTNRFFCANNLITSTGNWLPGFNAAVSGIVAVGAVMVSNFRGAGAEGGSPQTLCCLGQLNTAIGNWR